MKDDEVFDAHFPGALQRLQELRAEDAEFDAICSDYRDLFEELARLPGTEGAPPSRYIADLAESLSDLRGDIQDRLKSLPGGTP